MKKYLFLIIVSTLTLTQNAQAMLIGNDIVDGRNSLYSTDWGHTYNGLWDGANASEYNALNAGLPARAFQVSNLAYAFFANDHLQITASGCVNDENETSCTGPEDAGGNFRGLPVYSLIGVWSSNPISIVSNDSAFVIGNFLDLLVPDFNSPTYLFMATNDGNFSDNSGAYNISISRLTQVSEPSLLGLLLMGFFVLITIKQTHSSPLD